jgi:hypothetical protein
MPYNAHEGFTEMSGVVKDYLRLSPPIKESALLNFPTPIMFFREQKKRSHLTGTKTRLIDFLEVVLETLNYSSVHGLLLSKNGAWMP